MTPHRRQLSKTTFHQFSYVSVAHAKPIDSKLFVRKKIEFFAVPNINEISQNVLKVAPMVRLFITKVKSFLI